MEGTTKVEIIRDGEVRWETVTAAEQPSIVLADTSDISDFSRLKTESSKVCIYCGSIVGLTREHILPYALGGTVTIPSGSCERCREITSAFETAVLRGPMRMVRYIQSAPSRSKHRDVPKTIPVTITLDGREVLIQVIRDEAPILLPFPIFAPPDDYSAISAELKLVGVATGSFGADPEAFAKRHGSKEIELKIVNSDAIAFARMVAKIAYATAQATGDLDRVKNKFDLVRAMMEEPNTIGRFVGTLRPPFKKYPGVQHRIFLRETDAPKVMIAEIQLFARVGAPTYVVVLGTL